MPQTSFSSETPQGLYNSLIYKHLKILLANGLEQPIRKQYFKHENNILNMKTIF
jgi:hypothetical protein